MSTWIDYNPLFCFVLFYNYVCLTYASYHPAKASPAHQKVFILAMKSTSESRIRARNSDAMGAAMLDKCDAPIGQEETSRFAFKWAW